MRRWTRSSPGIATSISSIRSDLLREWLQRQGTAAYVSRGQIYSFLDIAPDRQNNYNAQRIRKLMANHGWKYDRRRINKKWVRAFWNPCRPE